MAELRVVIPDEVDNYLDIVIKSGMFGNKAELARAAIVQYLNTIGPISKGYDTDNFFSPEGRIHQIEYARESVKRGAPIMAIVCKDGILMASEDISARTGNSLMMSPMNSSVVVMSTFMIGSRRIGAAWAMASLKAIDPAILKAISEESTS